MKKMNSLRQVAAVVIPGIAISLGITSCATKAESEAQPVAEEKNETPKRLETIGKPFVLTKQDLELVEVKRSNRAIEWPISGRVVAKNTTQIFSEVQGKILEVGFNFNEGVSFYKGQTILKLDSKEFELQLEAKRSSFFNILTGMMPDLKADYPDNYRQWLNYVQQYQSGKPLSALPPTQSIGEKYFVTSNQVYSAFYEIKAQEERLQKFTIQAPYSGLVTEALADKGSLVSPGQLLGTIINNRNYELEAAANLEVVSKLKVGDQITFRSNEISGEWLGTILRINDIVDPRTQNIPIYFSVAGSNLKAGMYLEGAFSGESFKDVFTIPSAVLTRDDKVLLLEDNTIKGKAVELVEFIHDSILVRGLSNNDRVIANQFNIPVEGLKISVVQ